MTSIGAIEVAAAFVRELREQEALQLQPILERLNRAGDDEDAARYWGQRYNEVRHAWVGPIRAAEKQFATLAGMMPPMPLFIGTDLPAPPEVV